MTSISNQVDMLLDTLIPVQRHSYSGLYCELFRHAFAPCRLEICFVVPHPSPPWYSQHLRMFFIPGRKKKKTVLLEIISNFHIISVFTLGQMYVIPSVFVGKKENHTSFEWMNEHAWVHVMVRTFCSTTFSTKRLFLLLTRLLFLLTLIL